MKTPKKQEKKKVVPSRPHGKTFEQDLFFLKEIYEGKKYVIFHSLKGIVHIIPDEKLKEMLKK